MRSFLRSFSFYGRSKRSAYWLYTFISIAIWICVVPILVATAIKFDVGQINETIAKSSPEVLTFFEPIRHVPAALCFALAVIGIVILVALYVAWLAIAVRRLHDMGATGWLVLIFAALSLVFSVYGGVVTTLVFGLWPSSRKNRFGLPDKLDIVGVFDDRRQAGFTR